MKVGSEGICGSPIKLASLKREPKIFSVPDDGTNSLLIFTGSVVF